MFLICPPNIHIVAEWTLLLLTGNRRSHPPPRSIGVHEDLIRTGERIVDFQFRLLLDRLERTDQLIRLGVATFAGMIAVVGILITQGGRPGLAGISGMATGILATMWGVYSLARLNTALHREKFLNLGPDFGDLNDKVEADHVVKNDYDRYMAQHMSVQIDANAVAIGALSERQDRSIRILALGVVIYTLAIAYILGGFILG